MEKTREYIQSELQRIKDLYPGRKEFPKILFWYDTLNDAIMPNLYRSFDCFVLPTRGEGFGLPMMESIACGVPTIGPAWGGNTEFMNEGNSFLVGGNVVPIADQSFLRLQPQYSGQKWFDINEPELSQKMRWVYDNQDAAKSIALRGAEEIKDKWTWDNTVGKIYKRLLEIDGGIDV